MFFNFVIVHVNTDHLFCWFWFIVWGKIGNFVIINFRFWFNGGTIASHPHLDGFCCDSHWCCVVRGANQFRSFFF